LKPTSGESGRATLVALFALIVLSAIVTSVSWEWIGIVNLTQSRMNLAQDQFALQKVVNDFIQECEDSDRGWDDENHYLNLLEAHFPVSEGWVWSWEEISSRIPWNSWDWDLWNIPDWNLGEVTLPVDTLKTLRENLPWRSSPPQNESKWDPEWEKYLTFYHWGNQVLSDEKAWNRLDLEKTISYAVRNGTLRASWRTNPKETSMSSEENPLLGVWPLWNINQVDEILLRQIWKSTWWRSFLEKPDETLESLLALRTTNPVDRERWEGFININEERKLLLPLLGTQSYFWRFKIKWRGLEHEYVLGLKPSLGIPRSFQILEEKW